MKFRHALGASLHQSSMSISPTDVSNKTWNIMKFDDGQKMCHVLILFRNMHNGISVDFRVLAAKFNMLVTHLYDLLSLYASDWNVSHITQSFSGLHYIQSDDHSTNIVSTTKMPLIIISIYQLLNFFVLYQFYVTH